MTTAVRAGWRSGGACRPAPPSRWDIDIVDLGDYFSRVGVRPRDGPSLAALRELQEAHVETIPFENLDVLAGRTPSLELEAIFEKLVRRARGGYCFEHNLLFAAVLERVGFLVDRMIGRIRMGADEVLPRTHMMLRVQIPDTGLDRGHLVDVGFGTFPLPEPLPLVPGCSAAGARWTYRIDEEEPGTWVLRHQRPGGRQDLYSFRLEPQHPADYRMANHFSATYPNSPFRDELFVTRASLDRQLSLRGWELTETTAEGADSRTVRPRDLGAVLSEGFGIQLSDEKLESLLRGLPGPRQ